MAKKLFYKIGEACKKVDVQPYVLRYWETEFPFLDPDKSKSGQRVYSEKDLSIIRRVKELLYDEGYTIAGAKKKLEAELEESPDGRPRPLETTAAGGSAAAVDRVARKRIKTLRAGIEGALRESREILEMLEAKSS